MNKRVHQIAKERGLASKDVLARLRAAGIDVKAASSNVDEDVALKILGNGAGSAASVTSAPAKAAAQAGTEAEPQPTPRAEPPAAAPRPAA